MLRLQDLLDLILLPITDVTVAGQFCSMIKIAGQSYWAMIGSDLEREGMFLEVTDAANALVAELFYFDGDESITLTAHRPDIPLPVLEWMIGEAKARLVPAK